MANTAIIRPPGDMAMVSVPVPPSVNALYRNVAGRGRVKTKEYSDWFAVAHRELRRQSWDRVPGKVIVCMKVSRLGPAADLDNRIKATLDLMVKTKLMDDDRHVVGLSACWSDHKDGQVLVAVMKATSMDFKFHLSADGGGGSWFINPPEQDVA